MIGFISKLQYITSVNLQDEWNFSCFSRSGATFRQFAPRRRGRQSYSARQNCQISDCPIAVCESTKTWPSEWSSTASPSLVGVVFWALFWEFSIICIGGTTPEFWVRLSRFRQPATPTHPQAGWVRPKICPAEPTTIFNKKMANTR